jgi:hypothetical protein
MRSIDEVYGSNSEWLKAADLQGRDCNCRISEVSEEAARFDETKQQFVLKFDNLPGSLAQKRLGLAKTNAIAVAALYGKVPDTWIGRYITLYPTQTMSRNGQLVDCIRVRNVVPQKQTNGQERVVRRTPAPNAAVTARPTYDLSTGPSEPLPATPPDDFDANGIPF